MSKYDIRPQFECHYSLVVTCWERADLLAAILCVTFSFVAVTFPYDVLGQVWYLIVSNPDLYLLSYFSYNLVLISIFHYYAPKGTLGGI